MNAAIFDMDGLLLDTEPLWGKSMLKVARHYQVPIGPEHFKYTTGLRIYEVTEYWQKRFPWPGSISSKQIAEDILDDIIDRAKTEGRVMPGAIQSLEWLQKQEIKTGVATSSPQRMLQSLISFFDLEHFFEILLSADTALVGKPHPEVYMQCAHALNIPNWDCIAFEDSVNGMVSAKAARMKVIVVPEAARFHDPQFGLADVKLHSLNEFGEAIWLEAINR